MRSGQPPRRALEQAFLAHQGHELFGIALAAKRPEPCAGTTAEQHRSDRHTTVPFSLAVSHVVGVAPTNRLFARRYLPQPVGRKEKPWPSGDISRSPDRCCKSNRRTARQSRASGMSSARGQWKSGRKAKPGLPATGAKVMSHRGTQSFSGAIFSSAIWAPITVLMRISVGWAPMNSWIARNTASPHQPRR